MSIIINKDRDNDFEIKLFEKNRALSIEKMEEITKVELVCEGKTYSSTEYSGAFDLTTYKDRGVITVKLGRIPFESTAKKMKIKVIVYFTSHSNGIDFFTFEASSL
jgi:hypothetical protein